MSAEVLEEWAELAENYKKLEDMNVKYLKQLKEVTSLQQNCLKEIVHQKYRMKVMTANLKKAKRKGEVTDAEIEDIQEKFMKREVDLQTVELTLPKNTSSYLKLVLGDIGVSFTNKEEKFTYKDEYEKFKLINHVVAFIVILLILYFPYRPLEQLYLWFLVWYYCTISIRESILKANGSRIKGWWRVHHLLSTVSSGLLLIWPDNDTWQMFRFQFICYNIYNCFIQYLQFKYQRGTLYRLKALGKRDNMDITIEGFHSWMWRGLTFLLPFLFAGYLFQLANCITLYKLAYHPHATWHVMASSLMFLVFFVGNTTTTIMVVPAKIKNKMINNYRLMRHRLYDAVSEKIRLDIKKVILNMVLHNNLNS